MEAAILCKTCTYEFTRGKEPGVPRKCLKMIWKLQACARQQHVNLSEGSVVSRDATRAASQKLENDLEAASLCKPSTCKFIRGISRLAANL